MSFTLTTPASFNLPAVVRSHGWIQMPPFAETSQHGLSYVIRMSTGKVLHFEANPSTMDIRVSTTELLSEVN